MEVQIITELFFKYKSWIFTGITVLVLFISMLLFFKSEENSIETMIEPMSNTTQIAHATTDKTESDNSQNPTFKTVFIEIKGAVKKPGVYELPSDGRVKNVIEIAELNETADLKTINQAEKLKDEMVIYIPKVGEHIEEKIFSSNANEVKEETTVNINTADQNELTTLNGIGEKKAQAILNYREENGLFMKVEDLLNIPGIGEKTLENLKPYITIGD